MKNLPFSQVKGRFEAVVPEEVPRYLKIYTGSGKFLPLADNINKKQHINKFIYT